MRLSSDVASRVADPYLARAAALAERARGATSPNPLVGCVVVRDGHVVGEGFHARAGEPHAEVLALAAAGESARDSDVYVTLEPCDHTGKTPPCVDALIAAGIARVVVGMRDPNPEAQGGIERLRAAGIAVEVADDPSPFEEMNEGWLKYIATGTPFVTAKVGVTLDARPSFKLGERASITGPSGARVTAQLRAAADAVMVSAATVVADDPALTVRSADGRLATRQPLRVVLVRTQVPPCDARLFRDGAAPTLVLSVGADSGADAPLACDVLTHRIVGGGLREAIAVLGERGVVELLVEPGPRLLTALWSEGVLDQLVVVSAGGMGGDAAPPLFLGTAESEDDALVPRMTPVESRIVGDVSAVAWRPRSVAGDSR